MPYSQRWGGPHPGCLIILLDQSGSMNDNFRAGRIGENRKKSDVVATVLNNLLEELIKSNTTGQQIKSRADIAVLGYGDNVVQSALPYAFAGKSFATLPELRADPLRIETRIKKEMDDMGSLVELPVYFPILVEPKAGGNTPMTAALTKARELAEQWVAAHPDNYPPVVLNVTDGAATDVSDIKNPAELLQAADALRRVRTSDGEALLFTCHITEFDVDEVHYPEAESQVPSDPYNLGLNLFRISSELPEAARTQYQTGTGQLLPAGARGFIYNGDAASIGKLFWFATIGATIDPNK